MANCKHCGEPITFSAHPTNPKSLAPFNLDGSLHFGTCSSKPGKTSEYAFQSDGDYTKVRIAEKGDGNSAIFKMVIESEQNIRCQNLKTGSTVFLEITGEWEWQQFISAIKEYDRKRFNRGEE